MKHTAVNKMIKWIISMRIQKLLIQIFHLDILKIGHNIWSASTYISRDATAVFNKNALINPSEFFLQSTKHS